MRARTLGILTTFMLSTPALAFNSLTHQELIKSALQHLEHYLDSSGAASKWTGQGDAEKQRMIRNLLVRSTVDEDYRANIYLDAAFHSPFVGAKGENANVFTTFSHHLNVSVPGKFWEFDGYAYKNTDGTGNDKYLGLSTVSVKGELSNALGGGHSHFIEDNDIGAYQLGFQGTQQDWERMFFGDNKASEAVFPPANVPAELAKDRLLASSISKVNKRQVWSESLTLASGIFSSDELHRRFWRAEVEGLPSAFDLLGTVLHMVQDLSVPHHTQGTGSYCHAEIETLGDTLACGKSVEVEPFDLGTYDENPSLYKCQKLYDPLVVETLRNTIPSLSTATHLSISDRLKEIAKLTVKWRWGKEPRDEDLIKTVLPSGLSFVGKSCESILARNEVRTALKHQYNFAVAATVVVFELLAKEYQKIP